MRCFCSRLHACPKHPGVIGWLRRFASYWRIEVPRGAFHVSTPLGGFSLARNDFSTRSKGPVLCLYLLPCRWNLTVDEGESMFRRGWKYVHERFWWTRKNRVDMGLDGGEPFCYACDGYHPKAETACFHPDGSTI